MAGVVGVVGLRFKRNETCWSDGSECVAGSGVLQMRQLKNWIGRSPQRDKSPNLIQLRRILWIDALDLLQDCFHVGKICLSRVRHM